MKAVFMATSEPGQLAAPAITFVKIWQIPAFFLGAAVAEVVTPVEQVAKTVHAARLQALVNANSAL